MTVKVGDVVTLRSAGQERNAIVLHVLEGGRINLVTASPHEGDVGTHGRLTEFYRGVPHQSQAKNAGDTCWEQVIVSSVIAR